MASALARTTYNELIIPPLPSRSSSIIVVPFNLFVLRNNSVFFKKSSNFMVAIFAGAFAFEIAFDTFSDRVWDHLNAGIGRTVLRLLRETLENEVADTLEDDDGTI
ncbi:hypothetical protein BC832DRAFT_539725 [Gaertneriomyces semiglobifer]|nr:hypothetical protein BC832DRAFT_539725 [Gaertneriomyces semiglobifer]